MGLTLELPKIDTGPFYFGSALHTGIQLPPFDRWLARVTPSFTWDWPHLAYIRAALDQVTSGTIDRLMIFCPPRHGKSAQVTVRYPVWRLARDPDLSVILGAYNQTLANRFSRQARKIAQVELMLDPERSAVEEWQTTAGGGVRAVGVGSGITGAGGRLIMIDDPVKSREEAESQAYRDRVWDWYTDDLYTRREPGCAIVLIQTRWHTDDLAGRILESEDGPNWTVVNLPALAEEDDPLGRVEGAALCPARYDEGALAEIRTVLGSYSFGALYQQHPTPREGGMFGRAWFTVVPAAPAQAHRIRYWDKAGTRDGGAYSCGVLMARTSDRRFIVEDVIRGQWAAGEREAIIRQTAILDRARVGNVAIIVEQEPGSGGKESAESTIQNLAGFNVSADRATGDKVVRADPFAAQCQAGNVDLLEGAWNIAYLDELCTFPMGKYKDQVDASSGAFNKLALAAPSGGLAMGRTKGWGL